MSHATDETLSALVDDEAVADADAAHVAACDVCQGRLASLQAVRGALARPITPPAHLREAAVRGALAESHGAARTIRRLVSRGAPTSPRPRRMSGVSAAAALVVALGVGAWLLSQSGSVAHSNTGSNLDAIAASTTRPRTESAAAAPLAKAGVGLNPHPAQAPSGGSYYGYYDAGDIGAHNSTATILDRYRQDLGGPKSPSADSSSGTTPCPTPAGDTIMWHASLIFNGIDAYARVLMTAQGAEVLEVLDQADCALVESQAI